MDEAWSSMAAVWSDMNEAGSSMAVVWSDVDEARSSRVLFHLFCMVVQGEVSMKELSTVMSSPSHRNEVRIIFTRASGSISYTSSFKDEMQDKKKARMAIWRTVQIPITSSLIRRFSCFDWELSN